MLYQCSQEFETAELRVNGARLTESAIKLGIGDARAYEEVCRVMRVLDGVASGG
jgi:hypothetical protein